MKEIDPKNDPLYLLTKSVEKGDPDAAKQVKDRLVQQLLLVNKEDRFLDLFLLFN